MSPSGVWENQVFPNAVKPPFVRRTVAFSGQAAQALFLAGANRAANVYGVWVDEKKGGRPQSPDSLRTRVSLWVSGVSRARRSAKFWRDKRLGKSERIAV